MACSGGPDAINTNLVLALDAANKVSYSGTGTNWYDLSGTANSGSLKNSPTFSGGNGGSIVFDGTDDYVVSGNVNVSNTNVISVDMWVKVINYREVLGSANILLELSSNFNSVTTGFVVAIGDDSNPVFSNTYPIVLALQGNVGYNINYWNKTLVNDLSTEITNLNSDLSAIKKNTDLIPATL